MPINKNVYSLNVGYHDICEAEDNYPEFGIVKGFWHVELEATVVGPEPQEAEKIEHFETFKVTLYDSKDCEVYEIDLIKAAGDKIRLLTAWAECLTTHRLIGRRKASISDCLMEDANEERMVWED
jgi:hypothetical protein